MTSSSTLTTKDTEGVVFGAVDMAVTLLGVILGLSFSNNKEIILTAILATGIADSFANASGIYAISHVGTNKLSIIPAILCFLSTIITMAIIITPFVIYDTNLSTYISVTISLLILVLLGYYVSDESPNSYRTPIRFLFTGVIVSIITYIIGSVIIK